MKRIDGFCLDNNDGSIRQFLADFDRCIPKAGTILIGCLDSDQEVANLVENSQQLKENIQSFERFFNGILVSRESLERLRASKNYFTGFDEIWVFGSRPKISLRPTQTLVGPHSIEETYTPELGKWMADTGCLIGIGDGSGLNVITPDDRLCSEIHGRYS
jgi:hypothetical protein